jgi:peptidoglycan/xylan/chitin deacetylase (PgdA/CDA1 family)
MGGRDLIKHCTLAASRFGGLQRAVRRHNRNRLTVLCYHGVVSNGVCPDPYLYRNTVTADEFESHLRILRGYQPVTAQRVREWLREQRSLPERAVLVTLDDGYRNQLQVAAPLLRKHGVPALVGISTDYIGSDDVLWAMEVDMRVLSWPKPHLRAPDEREFDMPNRAGDRGWISAEIRRQCKTLSNAHRMSYVDEVLRKHPVQDAMLADPELWKFMNWDEVRELHGHDIEIASHTCSHPILSRLAPEDLGDELERSKSRIEEELSAECNSLIYPNGAAGDTTPDVMHAVRSADYDLAFTLMETINPERPDPLAIDRIGIPGHTTIEAFHFRVSGLHSLLRTHRRR